MSERDLFFGTSGPRDASIAIAGEAWGFEEMAKEQPFVGASGQEFRRMLSEANIAPDSCFMTNVVSAKPPNNDLWQWFYPSKTSPEPATRGLHPTDLVKADCLRMYRQLEAVKPKLIVAVGNYALWALTNCTKFSTTQESEGRRVPSGIDNWRGSMWYADATPGALAETKLLPIIHPASVLRAWYQRPIVVHDLRERVPMALRDDWRPLVPPIVLAPPTFDEAIYHLDNWTKDIAFKPLDLVSDIETARGLITCIGFADSASFAMTIPFIRLEGMAFASYWTVEQEREIVSRIRTLLSHRNCHIIGQNFLYDTQYIRPFLACNPNLQFDTMLAHHLLFPGTPKGLDYLSSLYCKYHWYWKEDGKEWDLKGDLRAHLEYNALDCLRTFEVFSVLRGLIQSMGQSEQWQQEMEKNALALRMMVRGIRIDQAKRGQLALELMTAQANLAEWFERIIPKHISQSESKVAWYSSPTQQRLMFSEEFGFRLPVNRKTGQPTMGKEAIRTLSERHPEFARLFTALGDYRSLSVFHKTFVRAPLDFDGRMRCMFNVAGTETFRWSSSENAFGRGTNLQNIPSGNEDD